MVTIVAVSKKTSSKTNEEFTVLHVQGNPEVLKSKTTGRPYLSAHKATLPCTLDINFAKTLIGSTLNGSIELVDCKEYEIVLPGGKKLKVNRSFQYNPDPVTVDEVVG
jgi:hypothetical protein